MSNMNQHINDDFKVFLNSSNRYACIATDVGFTIYAVHPLKKIISREIQGGVSIIKMLDESNIFVFVGRSDNGPYPYNKFIIWDDNKKVILGEILYNQKIQNIDVTQKYIYVQTDKKLYIYQFDNLLLLKQLDCNNSTNFSVSHKNNEIIVYSTLNSGEICILDMKNENNLGVIQAHNSNIEQIIIDNDGKYIATASEKGTIIRLYDVDTKSLLNEFRRGTEKANITQLAFHPNMSMLLVESDKGTIHIFNTEIAPKNDIKVDNISNEIWKVPQNRVFENYGIIYVKFLLPSYFHSKWSFMSYTIPNINTLNVFDEETCMIYSFGSDGQYYECSFNDTNNPTINKVMKYIADKDDPFKDRKNT